MYSFFSSYRGGFQALTSFLIIKQSSGRFYEGKALNWFPDIHPRVTADELRNGLENVIANEYL